MAVIETKIVPAGLFRRIIDGIDRIVDMLTSAFAKDQRYDEVLRLQAKSDAELAEMGLTRDKIAAHVFRDMIYV